MSALTAGTDATFQTEALEALLAVRAEGTTP